MPSRSWNPLKSKADLFDVLKSSKDLLRTGDLKVKINLKSTTANLLLNASLIKSLPFGDSLMHIN
jgi:hypothetical protein